MSERERIRRREEKAETVPSQAASGDRQGLFLPFMHSYLSGPQYVPGTEASNQMERWPKYIGSLIPASQQSFFLS